MISREQRRAPLGDRPLEHRGLERVDEDQDELVHRRIRRPSYFWPARRRRASSTQAQNATHVGRLARPARASAAITSAARSAISSAIVAAPLSPRADSRSTAPPRNARAARKPSSATDHAGEHARLGRSSPAPRATPRTARRRARHRDDRPHTPGTATSERSHQPRADEQHEQQHEPPGWTPGTRTRCCSKSTPTFARASAPTNSGTRNARTPAASDVPIPCEIARKRSMSMLYRPLSRFGKRRVGRTRLCTVPEHARRFARSPSGAKDFSVKDRHQTTSHEIERYAGLFAQAHAADALLGDARPDGDHGAPGGDLPRRRPARHLLLPARDVRGDH